MMDKWMHNQISDCLSVHNQISDFLSKISLCLHLAALIPMSTAEVEQLFSLMKLIDTYLWCHLSQESIAWYMRICKFWELLGSNYQAIFQSWNAESTKFGQRKVASHLEHN